MTQQTKIYPPFCPIHKIDPENKTHNTIALAFAKLACDRFQSCRDCIRENTDQEVKP